MRVAGHDESIGPPHIAELSACHPRRDWRIRLSGLKSWVSAKRSSFTSKVIIEYYGGDASKFAWIVPLPEVPEVEVGSWRLVKNVLDATVPVYGFQDGDSCGGGSPGGGGFIDTQDGGAGGPPEVVAHDVVGEFEYVVLQGGTRGHGHPGAVSRRCAGDADQLQARPPQPGAPRLGQPRRQLRRAREHGGGRGRWSCVCDRVRGHQPNGGDGQPGHRRPDASVFTYLHPVQVVDALTQQGLMQCFELSCSYTHELVPSLLHEFVPVPAGTEEHEFYDCLSCNAPLVDHDAWNGAAFSRAFRERITDPLDHARELLAMWPYVTRLYTRISPREMLSDPMFGVTANLPDVAHGQGAERNDDCCRATMRLPGGREVRMPNRSTWPESPAEMPWAERVEEYVRSGPGEDPGRPGIGAFSGQSIGCRLGDRPSRAGRRPGPEPEARETDAPQPGGGDPEEVLVSRELRTDQSPSGHLPGKWLQHATVGSQLALLLWRLGLRKIDERKRAAFARGVAS